MPDVQAKILQISDLHLNRKVDKNVLEALRDIVADKNPHVLIVSGDLANQPVSWQMRRAAKFVQDLVDACPTRPAVLVVPGNHDYKFWGNVGLRRLSRIPFHVYFRRDGLSMPWYRRWLDYIYLALNALWPWGSEIKDQLQWVEDQKLGLVIAGFDSNPLRESFTLATGKMDSAQLRELVKLTSAGRTNKKLELAYRIAVVHHHPAPIADVPVDLKARWFESFMIFQDAGTFLREMSRHEFHLVLHGHKHFAGFVRIGHEIKGKRRMHLGIAAAGTACHPVPDDCRGHHFNLVELLDDDTVRMHSWFFSPAVLRKEESRVHLVQDLSEVRRRRYEALQLQKGFTVAELIKTVSITQDGYSLVISEIRDCRVTDPAGQDGFDVDLRVPKTEHSYLRGPREERVPNAPPLFGLEEAVEEPASLQRPLGLRPPLYARRSAVQLRLSLSAGQRARAYPAGAPAQIR